MNKTLRNVLLCILAVSLLTIVILIGKLNARLPENPPEYSGNTAGNLYNHGLFVRSDNKIYFANVADNFRLYEMNLDLTNAKRLQSDSVEYLNIDSFGSHLYYSRINYRKATNGNNVLDLQTSGIYRLETKNNTINRLFSDPCGTILLAGNRLLFQKHGADGDYDLYSINCTKRKDTPALLSNSYYTPANYYNNVLYYAGVTKDHKLYAYHPDTDTTEESADIDCYLPITGRDGTYFLSMSHNYALCLLPHTSDKVTMISTDRICTYNLSEDQNVLFYQTDKKKDNRLCRYDIYAKTETTLMEGDFKNLNTVGTYLFFTDFNETVCYCYNISDGSIIEFAPEHED